MKDTMWYYEEKHKKLILMRLYNRGEINYACTYVIPTNGEVFPEVLYVKTLCKWYCYR